MARFRISLVNSCRDEIFGSDTRRGGVDGGLAPNLGYAGERLLSIAPPVRAPD
jgi:hypothetical protein